MSDKKQNTGLFLGSFNPIHIGHLALANYILEYSDLDEIWFVVSPTNPFKDHNELINEHHRLTMVEIAIADESGYKTCDVEFNMSRPSYTIDTLNRLSNNYPNHNFNLIMGSDNISILDSWKDGQSIRKHYKILLYPRTGFNLSDEVLSGSVSVIDAPLIDISSTMIRKLLAEGKNIPFLLPRGVFKYIRKHKLYGLP